MVFPSKKEEPSQDSSFQNERVLTIPIITCLLFHFTFKYIRILMNDTFNTLS